MQWTMNGFVLALNPQGLTQLVAEMQTEGEPKAYFIMLLAFLKVGKRRLALRLAYMELALSLGAQSLEFTSQLCHLSIKIIVPKF